MKISVELTLTPLQDNYEAPIKTFIKRLRAGGFTIKETPLSTQLYGEYDQLMAFMTTEVKSIFEAEKSIMLHIKLIKGDRSAYVPSF
ncbi:MAG: hypothetical protein ACON42_06810 [Flavobacteriaceae bacterium]